jgi:hypothetical protein
MNIILYNDTGIINISAGIEQFLVHYIQTYGEITCLDKWAHEWGISPYWINRCAHAAAKKRLLNLTRLENISGRPYQVTLYDHIANSGDPRSKLEERYHE